MIFPCGDPLERADDGDGEDGRPVLGGGLEDRVDPLVGQTGPGGIVDRDELAVRFDLGEGFFDRVGPLLAAPADVDPQDGDVGAELAVKLLGILLGDHDDHLLDVRAVEKFLGRMQPDGPPRQRRERLFVVLIAKPTTGAGGGHNHGKVGHGSFR